MSYRVPLYTQERIQSMEQTQESAPRPDQPGLRPNRACRNCIQIKAKCIPLTEALTACERCNRLGKSCTTPAPAPRRVRKTSKVTQFRSKSNNHTPAPRARQTSELPTLTASEYDLGRPSLEDFQSTTASGELSPGGMATLVYIVMCSVRNTSIFHVQFVPSAVDVMHFERTRTSLMVASCYRNERFVVEILTHVCVAPSEPTNSIPQEHFPNGRTHGTDTGIVFDISPEIGHFFVAPIHESLFEQYRMSMSGHFPFVPMPPGTSTYNMIRDRPFLYTCCVMSAAHRDPPLQERIAKDILKYVSEHMILRGEKSLDLLQGLLVATTWYPVHTHNSSKWMNLIHLAKALSVDLGLNRPPGFGIFQMKTPSDATGMIQDSKHEARYHRLEERRACLGVYHVYNKYNAAFRRADPTPWSEHPSDANAVAYVRLNHLVERYTGAGGFKPGTFMPIPAYVKLFSEEIDRLRQSLPDLLRNCPSMLDELQASELCLFEPIIGAEYDVPAQKVEAYHACLKRCLAYWEAFVSQDVAKAPYLPLLNWVMIKHALGIVAQLSFAQAEGWDVSYVRSVASFEMLADKMMALLKNVQAYEDATYPKNRSIRFKVFCLRVDMFKQWFNSQIQQETLSEQTQGTEHTHNERSSVVLDPLPKLNDFSDLLWQDFNIDWSRLDSDLYFD